MFNIDFKKIVFWMLPFFRQKPVFQAWIQALAAEINYVNGELVSFVKSTLVELSYSSQVILLEAALNNTFPGASPPIYISDGDGGYQTGYDYLITDLQPDPGGFDYLITDMQPDPGGFDYLAEAYSTL